MAVKLGNGEFTLEIDEQSKNYLFKKMDGLMEIEKEEAIRRGLRQGASVIVHAGKRNYILDGLRMITGGLYKSAGVTTSRKALKVWGGFKRPLGAAAHLLDRGTKERYTKDGYYRGKVKARYFWNDAYQTEKRNASNKVIDVIDKTVEALWG